MSRLTGGNASWPQTDPSYLMRFGPFGPWPGPPARPAAAAGDAGVSHHHPAAAWGPSPGPFGILPHQESVSPAPATASAASYGFAAGAKSSLHRQHATEQYIAAMNAAAHDQNYNRYQQVLGHMSMSSSRSPAASSSSRAMHQHQMHSAQYSAMNSFPGSERLARDLMSATSYSQQSQHQNNIVGMDPNAMLMSSSWYPVPRMPAMSHRMPGASGQSRRSNDIVPAAAPAAGFAAAWNSYSGGGQSIAMHQGHVSSKYPVAGSGSGAYHSATQQNTGSQSRSHSAASGNNHQLNHPTNSFNNYLSNCGMQMMNGLNSSPHLLPASAMISHSPHQQQHHNNQQQHASANYAASSNSGNGASMSTSPAHGGAAQRSGNVSAGSNSSSGHGSRSNSVTPNHSIPVGPNSDTCPYAGYSSPSANSAHNSYSPYPSRSASAANNNTASSHTPTPHGPSPVLSQPIAGDAVSGYDSSGGSSGYSSSGASQAYPVLSGGTAAMQRLTPPSSGYPTPPASVSQAQAANVVVAPAEDSSHGLHSHFPLTPQSGSSYYSSSSGYSSNSKCSTDSVVSAGSASGASTNGNSCMVAAAAAAAGYPSHMHSMSSESGLAEATQPSSCLTGIVDSHHAKGMNPGPVSIAGGEADPNLGSVFTEQEIEFPSIGYGNEPDSAYSAVKVTGQQSAPKKRKEKSKKDKKKKEKAKQVAAADRIALSSFVPFDVPVPHFSHQHPLNTFVGQVSLTSSVVMNPYLLPNHTLDQSDMMAHMSGGASFFANNSAPNDMLITMQSVPQNSAQVTQQISSHHQQHETMSQQGDPALHAPAINNVPAQDQRMHEKDSFADLEDDLRLLTEGSSSGVCQQDTTQQTALPDPDPAAGSAVPATDMEMAFAAAGDHSQSSSQPLPQSEQNSFQTEPVTVRIPDTVQLRSGLTVVPETGNETTSVADDLLDLIQKSGEHENDDPSSFNPDGSHPAPSHPDVASGESSPAKKKKKKSKDSAKDKSEKVKSATSKSSSHQQEKRKIKSEESLKSKAEAYETYIPIVPQGKSSHVHESTSMHPFDKKIAAAPAAAGDIKFFKNRPQNVIPVTEKRTDSAVCNGTSSHKKDAAVSGERTAVAKKRKVQEEVRNQTPHDEYEFRESPSETTRKRAKKAITTPAVPPVAPKAGKKSASSDKMSPAAPPVTMPVPSLQHSNANAKKLSAKSGKSNTNKSTVKTEPHPAPLPSNSVKCPISSQKCDSSRVAPGFSDPLPSALPKAGNKSAGNHVAKAVQQKHPANSGKEGKLTPVPVSHHKTPLTLKSCDTQPVVQPAAAPKSSQMTVNGSSKKENAKTAGNVSVQSMGTNTPRRRSQDKKTLTIKEGLMRPHEFVVSIDEMNQQLPMIWRIEGKSLLQRFEPTLQDGQTVYINTSSVSSCS